MSEFSGFNVVADFWMFLCVSLNLSFFFSPVPVTMNPSTGSLCLVVSPDLSSVSACEEQPLADNLERFESTEHPGLAGQLGEAQLGGGGGRQRQLGPCCGHRVS